MHTEKHGIHECIEAKVSKPLGYSGFCVMN